MKPSLAISIAALGATALLFSTHERTRRVAVAQSPPACNTQGMARLSRLPVAFVPNVGQWEHAARFVARIGAMTVFLEENGWTCALVERTLESKRDKASARGVAVRMTFTGASAPELVAEERLPGRHNYFLGNDASKWRSDVPLYRAVRYREVHPGVDVRAREQDGRFEYDLVLQPDAELDPVEIAVEGIERMHIDSDALVLETELGRVRMPAPLSWEEGPSGGKSLVTCRYVLRGHDRFGFEVTGRRPGWALVVDPGIVWSTFLGGSMADSARALALDAQGAATVAGSTESASFPTTLGAFDTTFNGNSDAFVTRLSPTGSSLVYSTFLGGADGDGARALALDAAGMVTIAGLTLSADFPATAAAFDTSYNGGRGINGGDAFVARLSPTGSSLVYATFLGGTDIDTAQALALDAQGAVTVAGDTLSADFPTTPGAFDTTFNRNGFFDVFVTRISPTGSSLVYSTFLGGTGEDWAYALAVDAQGAATVAGDTSAFDFPTTAGAFDTSYNGRSEAFVTRLSPTGSSLVWSTYLGGTDSDRAHALALNAQGAVAVAGETASTDFPTTEGAFDRTHNGNYDAFVAVLSPTGARLDYATLLGGTVTDSAYAIALDAQGTATVAGRTSSATFPTTPGAFATTISGNSYDAFVSRLSPTGSSLVYSTFLGGTGFNSVYAVVLDAQGTATVAGTTDSGDFPTTPGGFDTTHNGNYDAFVTRLDMLPTGVAAFGRSSPGCSGPLAISVNSMPRAGNTSFALTCGNAPPNTRDCVVALAAAGLATPIRVLGAEIWFDPASAWLSAFAAQSNALGYAESALPIPANPALVGQHVIAQFVWTGPTSPPPCPPLGLSASNALDITIQP